MSKVELECPNCYSVVAIDQTHQACGCGYKFQISDQTIFLDKDERIAQELALYHSTGDGSTLTEAVLARVASSILVTTESAFPDLRIVKRIDIVGAECVSGIGLLGILSAGVNDLIGGRAEGIQGELRLMRQSCLTDLKREAALRGANAIVGTQFSYSQLNGKNTAMLMLAVSGTAVVIE
ncbi:YbjQ family protein [Parvibaculum sedimenti]|nr:heavy metal-binding domain-containing protein [Parvibaculum sedimenti]